MTYRDNAYILNRLSERFPEFYNDAKTIFETFEYSDEEDRITDMIDYIVNAETTRHPLMETPRG